MSALKGCWLVTECARIVTYTHWRIYISQVLSCLSAACIFIENIQWPWKGLHKRVNICLIINMKLMSTSQPQLTRVIIPYILTCSIYSKTKFASLHHSMFLLSCMDVTRGMFPWTKHLVFWSQNDSLTGGWVSRWLQTMCRQQRRQGSTGSVGIFGYCQPPIASF